MRTFRAISIGKAFREQLAHVEDHSEPEHSQACYAHQNSATAAWAVAVFRNNPVKPCPGNLWPFS